MIAQRSIYLSHHWKDNKHDDENIRKLVQVIRGHGLHCEITPENSVEVDDVVIEVAGKASYLLAVITKPYQECINGSNTVNVCRYEFINAFKRKIPVIPILLHNDMRDQNKWVDRMGTFLLDVPFLDFTDPEIFAHPSVLDEKVKIIGRVLDKLQSESVRDSILSIDKEKHESKDEFCPMHHQSHQVFDWNCQKLLCSVCMQNRQHDQHNLEPVAELKLKIMNKTLSNPLESSVSQNILKLEAYRTHLLAKQKSLEKQKDAASQNIQNHFHKIWVELRQREEEALRSIAEETRFKQQHYQEEAQYFERLIQAVRESLTEFHSCQEASKESGPVIASFIRLKEQAEAMASLRIPELSDGDAVPVEPFVAETQFTEESFQAVMSSVRGLGRDSGEPNKKLPVPPPIGSSSSSLSSTPLSCFQESKILSPDEGKSLFAMVEHIAAAVPFELLYRASRDGFTVSSFHSQCDDRGPALVLMKDGGGNVFGGYSAAGWTTPNILFGSYIGDPTDSSFLFSLVNPHHLGPVRCPLLVDCAQYAIFCDKDCGPSFGRGGNLVTKDMKNVEFHFAVHKFPSYFDGSKLGDHLFCNRSPANLVEVEVFRVPVLEK